jgi:hypothetical protein
MESARQLDQQVKEVLTRAQQSGSSHAEAAFSQLPDTLEELDELIQDAKAKLQVHLDTDADVLADYDLRAQEVRNAPPRDHAPLPECRETPLRSIDRWCSCESGSEDVAVMRRMLTHDPFPFPDSRSDYPL